MTAPRRKKRRSLGKAWRLVLVALGAVALAAAGFAIGRLMMAPPGSEPYRPIIERWCAAYNVNPNLAAAVLEVESSGRIHSVSPSGAIGLMQLMPATAEEVAKELGLKVPTREELMDPELNIRLGVAYLAKLRVRFGEEREFVIAAYHAGPTRVDAWRKRRADLPAAQLIETLAFPETRAYVKKVLARWKELGERHKNIPGLNTGTENP